MRLHLDRERDEPLLWEESVSFEPAALGQDLLVELTPIEVRGRVDRIDGDDGEGRGGARSAASSSGGPASFHVAMELRYSQALACTRCLQPVRSDVTAHTDLTVTIRPKAPHRRDGAAAVSRSRSERGKKETKKGRAKDGAAQPEVELEKDELGALVLEGEHLDTEPLIAEQIVLEVPMKPLCSPECRGLCPRCGADRNVVPECCEEPVGDERWEALGELRDRLSAESR